MNEDDHMAFDIQPISLTTVSTVSTERRRRAATAPLSVPAISSPREHIPIARLLADSLVFVRTFVITEDTYVALKDQPLVIGQNLCSYFDVDEVVVVKPDGSEAVVERDGVKVEAVG